MVSRQSSDIGDVKIKSNTLIQMTECIICSETFTKCNITKCGHSFCEKCILDCINLQNFCPTCKTPMKKEELVKNYIIDDIISYVKKERAKEEYSNIEQTYLNNEANQNFKMNNIQIIFFDNLKEIFNSYNSFYERIEKEYRMKMNDISRSIEEMKNIDANSQDIIKANKLMEELDSAHLNLIKDLERSLDTYMKSLPDSPLLLPIKTRIYIEKKKANIEHIQLNPTESVDKLYDIVKKFFESIHDEITDLGDAGLYIIRKNMGGNSSLIEAVDEIKIQEGSKVLSIGLLPGETLVFKGNYVLKSEVPKACFKFEYDKTKATPVNYFSCESCKLQWICEVCISVCHRGHAIKLFKEKHVPSWACCYCSKGNCAAKK